MYRCKGIDPVLNKCIPSPSGRGPGRGGKPGSQEVYPLSLRDADMDVGGRAPTVGALGEAWSSCREGQGEGGKPGSQEVYPLSLRDADMDVGGRAKHGAVAERARERGYDSGRVSG